MSLSPASNGLVPCLVPSHSPQHIQPPLPLQQFGLPSHDLSQPIPQSTYLDNLHRSELFNNSDSAPLSTFNVHPGPIQSANPSSHPILINDQPLLDFIWPTAIPPLPGGSYQPISTNQPFQFNHTCPSCTNYPIVGPVRFGTAQPALASWDTNAPSGASSSSTSYMNPVAPHTRPPILDVAMPCPGVIDADLTGWGPSADSGYTRGSGRVPHIRNRRRAREVPFVRIEEHIKWVSRDLMKMTLWFDWSPDAEVEAHGPRV